MDGMKHRDVYYSMAILFLIGLVVYQCDSAKDNERNALENNARLQSKIDARESSIAQRNDTIKFIREKRVTEREEFDSLKTTLQAKITGYKKTIATLRPEVSAQVDSLPIVKTFIALQDSTIEKQDSLNVALTGQIYDQSKSFEAELEQERGKFYEQVKNTEDYKQVAENATNLYEKIKRKKFSVGPNAGYGVSKDGLSPFVGVSVQYNLFRF